MLPKGFYGTSADILMDILVTLQVVILPILLWSFMSARKGRYQKHKKIQIFLASAIGLAVIAFEVDVRLSGGAMELFKSSSLYDGTFLWVCLGVHLFIAGGTVVVWVWLMILSVKRFPNPPVPNDFSTRHRFWGRVGMIGMVLTGITGIGVYYLGFAV
ncbi:MAG: DUF420 domain-containing protein [bacterium]|nr:DUF420 domain-containing protein [bacterium]